MVGRGSDSGPVFASRERGAPSAPENIVMSRARSGLLRRREPLRVGFMPLSDCAPVVHAQEAGLFAKYELDIELRREASCTALTDKLLDGELDAVHAPCTLPFLAPVGVESDPSPCVSALVLNLQGNAITISRRLWDEGVRDAASLREHIYRLWGRKTLTFGVTFLLSPQYFLLRDWLKSGGINPETEVRILAVPASQMFPTLRLGYLDGYCAGEPWPSLAAQAQAGVCVATSAQLGPRHPEKVLMVRSAFAAGSGQEHERLIAALLEACAYCDRPQNWPQLSEMLARPEYVNAPAECLSGAWTGGAALDGGPKLSPPALSIFHDHGANDPSDDKADWIIRHLTEALGRKSPHGNPSAQGPVLQNVFRPDAYARACNLMNNQASPAAARRSPAQPLVGLPTG
jgi:ABC-type nitrate/sulfonate/bicarbonate transport system substrate-binding protein